MTPANFVRKRMGEWRELESLLAQIEDRRDRSLDPDDMLRFARLYRAACTDLSLAEAFRLPGEMRLFLEDLVSRGHSNLYSFRKQRIATLRELFFEKIPALIYSDVFIRIALLTFYIPFALSLYLGYASRPFAVAVAGEAHLEQALEMHLESRENPSAGDALAGTGFYIFNNTSLALICFSVGILGGVLSILVLLMNAVYIGALCGFLLTTPARDNILSWLPGHGPFELTAIAIAAGAGLRIGFSLIAARGRSRMRALREESQESIPAIAVAVLLLVVAAFLEAALAPAELPLPWKLGVGGAATLLLIAYFGVYGSMAARRARSRSAD